MSAELYYCCSDIQEPETGGRLFPAPKVQVHWYRVGPRDGPAQLYIDWIEGYSEMRPNLQRWMRWVTDCYFTREEKDQLLEHLSVQRHWPASAQLVANGKAQKFAYTENRYFESSTFPPTVSLWHYFHNNTASHVCLGEYQQCYPSYPWCFLRLAKYPDYPLAFKVWGIYSPKR